MQTLISKISSLTDFVKKNNPYFDRAFSYAVQDANIGVINDGDSPIFPADEYGNYFYIRHPNGLGFDYSPQYIVGTNDSVGVTYQLILVAYIKEGNEGLLLQNIISTLGNYKDHSIRLTKFNFGNDVILQELSKLKAENINSALEKLPDTTCLCSVHFTFTIRYIYQSLACLTNPCTTCQ